MLNIVIIIAISLNAHSCFSLAYFSTPLEKMHRRRHNAVVDIFSREDLR